MVDTGLVADSDTTFYNPSSLDKFIGSGCAFDSYWSDTATLPLTKKLIKTHADFLNDKHDFEMSDRSITVFEIQELLTERHSPYLLCSYLRQVGYLSIVGNERWKISLGYPNREAKEFMARIIRGDIKTE